MDKDGSFIRVGELEDGEGALEGKGEGCRRKSKEDKRSRLRRDGSGCEGVMAVAGVTIVKGRRE